MDFTKMAELALRLISKNGQDCVLHKAAAPSDPTKPWNGTTSPDVTLPVKGVFLAIDATDDIIDVRREKMKVLVSGSGITDDLANYATVVDANAAVWTIDRALKVAPNGVVLLWDIRVSK